MKKLITTLITASVLCLPSVVQAKKWNDETTKVMNGMLDQMVGVRTDEWSTIQSYYVSRVESTLMFTVTIKNEGLQKEYAMDHLKEVDKVSAKAVCRDSATIIENVDNLDTYLVNVQRFFDDLSSTSIMHTCEH